jgi:hypothetical protein
MPDPFLRELLTPQGMADGHGAVIAAYEGFTHASEVRHFETMKKKGPAARLAGRRDRRG